MRNLLISCLILLLSACSSDDKVDPTFRIFLRVIAPIVGISIVFWIKEEWRKDNSPNYTLEERSKEVQKKIKIDILNKKIDNTIEELNKTNNTDEVIRLNKKLDGLAKSLKKIKES